jgi:hypothetical protein
LGDIPRIFGDRGYLSYLAWEEVAMNWREAGMIVELAPWFNPDPTEYGRLLRNNRFRWLSIKIHDGLGPNEIDQGWINRVRAAGISVGGWGVLQTFPGEEAVLASNLIGKHKLSHYIADAEGAHKNDWPGGDSKRSVEFTRVFHQLRPKLPRLFSTYGAAAGENILGHTKRTDTVMNFKTWYDYGWRFGPQVYPCEFGEVYSLDNCIKHAQRAAWPLSLVKPMIGNYNNWHAQNYKEDLRREYRQNKPLKGLSIFIANTTTDDDVRAYGSYIKNWWLADS